MLSKNHWVRPFFVFFRFTREILFVTVALDHPVYQLLGISSHKSQGPSHHRRSKLTLGCHFNSYQLLSIKFSKSTYPHRRSRRARDVVRNHINYQVTRSHTTHLREGCTKKTRKKSGLLPNPPRTPPFLRVSKM